MQVSCFRCGGDGKLPQYSWNKGGICFTCGGDGKVNTFSTIKLNKMTLKSEMRDYLKHSSNRDIANLFASGESFKLKPDQQMEARMELVHRAKNYYGINTGYFPDSKDLGKEVLKNLDALEKSMKDTYKKNAYHQAGKVSLVPVHWLQKFQGNSLRRDKSEMKEFAEKLKEEGLKDPVMIIIGQEDRRVSIGEGNHRTFAHIEAGYDYVPARVVRQTRNDGNGTYYYDKMSQVPKDDYFKADASPKEVFDTFYDHGDLPPEPIPSELDNHSKATSSFLEERTPSMYGTEDDLGVDISNVNLKDHGIRELWINQNDDMEEETETLKAIIAHIERVYGNNSDVIYRLVNDGVLIEADPDKLGSYRLDHKKSVEIFEMLSSYSDGQFAVEDDLDLLDLDDDEDDDLESIMKSLGY